MSGKCAANGKNVNAMPLSGSILLVILLASIAQKSPICGCKIPISLGCRSWCVLPWTGTDLWCLQSAGEAKLYHFCILLDLFNFQLFVYIYCFYEMTQVEVIVFATIQNLISHFITMISPFYKSVRQGTARCCRTATKCKQQFATKPWCYKRQGEDQMGRILKYKAAKGRLTHSPKHALTPSTIHPCPSLSCQCGQHLLLDGLCLLLHLCRKSSGWFRFSRWIDASTLSIYFKVFKIFKYI